MKSGQQGKVLYKILGVIAGLVLVFFGFQGREEITGVQKRGKRAVVEPITNYTEFKQSGSSTYTAEFHFTTEDGQKIVAKHSFPEEVLEDFKAGKPVEVVYLPKEPGVFVFANEKASWTVVVIGAGLALAALLLA